MKVILLFITVTIVAADISEWFASKGGYTNPKIKVTPNGIFATQDIQPRELILGIPEAARIGSYEEDADIACETIRALVQERKRGSPSSFAPLVEYFLTRSLKSPSAWSEKGQMAIDAILDDEDEEEDENQYDIDVSQWSKAIWVDRCGGNDDDLTLATAAMEHHREGILAPLVDAFRYQSGMYANVQRYGPPTETIEYRAKYFIQKGQELTISFEDPWEVAETFRTRGVILGFPQMWVFSEDLVFELDQVKDHEGNPTGELEVDWLAAPEVDHTVLEPYEELLQHIKDTTSMDLSTLPESEANAIKKYRSATVTAISKMLAYLEEEDETPKPVKVPTNGKKKSGDAVLDWFTAKGGYFNPKMEKKIFNDNIPRTELIATSDFKTDEILLVVPRSIIMEEEDVELSLEKFTDHVKCDTAELLLEEYEKGKASPNFPFVNDIMNGIHPKIPSEYSTPGKDVLREILGLSEEYPLTLLPAYDSTQLIADNWQDECAGYDGPIAEKAASRSIQFARKDSLIPIVNWFYHGSGPQVNTKSNAYDGEEDFVVRASRPIRKGELIRTSYDSCNGCGFVPVEYGTAELYRDFGIVEDYPHYWVFDGFAFNVYKKYDESGVETGDLEVVFDGEEGIDDEDLDLFQSQVARLSVLDNTPIKGLPDDEAFAIQKYEEVLKAAMIAVLKEYERDVELGVECSTDDETCTLLDGEVDELERQEREILNMYNTSNCDKEWIFRFPGYEHKETVNGLYQTLDFLVGPTDTQLQLDGIVQIAFDHRPHYHELHIQYASRFLKHDIRRIIWIGGGDSMLLHEILKYPNIELAVGLELDQNVTRYSYKYFGSQPHWDDEKVEWWYGDATKSLLMLPREYFGSFDLVLVDLSETVMSFKVTDTLSVVGALSLLMKPDGIFVKNDYHFTELSGIFKNTLQIFATDIPTVCVQAMSLGSNTLNFMDAFETDLRDHGVEKLYLMENDKIDDIFHDFSLNDEPFELECSASSMKRQLDGAVQARSPGILFVLEVEQAAEEKLESTESVLKALVDAISKADLDVVESISSLQGGTVPFALTVLKEGYVRAHSWKANGYCAIDIHFWGSYDKQVALKNALTEVFQSPKGASSSYRLVAGGLFGVPSWKDDDAKKGPNFSPDCSDATSFKTESNKDNEDASKGSKEEKSLSKLFVDGVFSLEGDSGDHVLVFCDSAVECQMADFMKSKVGATRILVIETCSYVKGLNEFSENFVNDVHKCVTETRKMISDLADSGKNINFIVIDTSVEYTMGRVIYEALSSYRLRLKSLSSSPMIVAPSSPDDYEWRRNILDRLKYEHIKVDPMYLVEADFSMDGSTIKTAFLHWGMDDNSFWRKYNSVRKQWASDGIDEKTYYILGGEPKYHPEHNPHKYLASDYDQADAIEQFKSQQATALQVHFQFESSNKLDSEKIESALTMALINAGLGPDGGVKVFAGLGEGVLMVSSSNKGDAIALWDGRTHLDIDLFMFEEDFRLVQRFEGMMTKQIPGLGIALRDVFPRGYGRNVSFKKDFADKKLPHWAY